LRLGKAFWISERTLLGVGLQAFAANMSDQNTTDTLKARAASLIVDVTYD
jgi:hypothetical protein